jgi:precorrin-6B methylase 2
MKDVNTLLNPPFPRSKVFSALLMKSLEGLKRYYLIMTAWENGLFDCTITPKTHQDIAKELGYQEIMTQMFCDALVELGLLIKTNGAYTNSQIASSYLSRDSSRCMVSTIQNMKANANRWTQLTTILKHGPITQDKEERFGDKWLISIAEWAAVGSVASAMKVIKANLKLHRWRRLLDIGGGHGLYAIAFTALNPRLEAFVFDLPKITPVTRKYVDTYNAERVHIIPGDFYKDDIDQDYDAIFSSFNHSCSDPALIPKLIQALKPGGDLILRRFKDASREGALKALDWNLVHFDGKKIGSKPHSSGAVVGREEYIRQLKAAGLTSIRVVSVDEMSEMIFARKPSDNGSEK